MFRLSWRSRCLLLCGVLLTSGCGYALAGRGSFLPADIRVVAIPQLQNQSTFFNVEQVLTERLRAELIGRGKYRVVTEPVGADASITGVITGINATPSGLNAQGLATRYQFLVTMRVEFSDLRSNTVLWSNEALTLREEIELANQTGVVEGASFLDRERASFERLAGEVARSVVTSILEAF